MSDHACKTQGTATSGKQRAVPKGRARRFGKFARLAGGVAGNMLAHGAAQLATGSAAEPLEVATQIVGDTRVLLEPEDVPVRGDTGSGVLKVRIRQLRLELRTAMLMYRPVEAQQCRSWCGVVGHECWPANVPKVFDGPRKLVMRSRPVAQ